VIETNLDAGPFETAEDYESTFDVGVAPQR
jgi:hypothetical protein